MKKRILWSLIAASTLMLMGAGALLSQSGNDLKPETTTRNFSELLGGRGAWLGVRISDVNSEMVRDLKLPGEYGTVVMEVTGDSPASRAGIEKGDVILGFAGEKVWSVAQLRRRIEETPPGRTVTLLVSRDGHTRSVAVKLEARSESLNMPPMQIPQFQMPEMRFPRGSYEFYFPGTARLGISGDDLTRQLADYFGVTGGKGVLVREVMRGTPAEKAGLKAGDCIVRLGTTDVGSMEDLRRAVAGANESKSKSYSLTIVRDRREQTLTVELEQPSTFDSGSVARSGKIEMPALNPSCIDREIRMATQGLKQTIRREIQNGQRTRDEAVRRTMLGLNEGSSL